MPKNLVILLAKAGDICSFLPIARRIAETDGEPISWIVHKAFEQILRGVSYVKPIPVMFDLRRVDLAVKLAESLNPGRIWNSQTFGKYYKGPTNMPYNYLAWSQNGFGEHFHDVVGYPLVFDRRDAQREARAVKQHLREDRPNLLLCLSCAKSASFAIHRIVTDSIRSKWSKHFHLVDLCSIRLPRFYDMVGLMEKSALLITADTAPLHLAVAAPGLPVIALVNDREFLGSECRYVPLSRIRYGDVLKQMGRIHADVASVWQQWKSGNESPPQTAPAG